MNLKEFLNRIEDFNFSLSQKKRLFDIINNGQNDIESIKDDIESIQDTIDKSLITEDKVIQLINENQPPNKQFAIKGVLTGNNNLNGYYVGGIFNASYFNIYIDDKEYSFNVASIINNNTDETYFNSDYYLVGDIELFGTTYYDYYPLLSCVSYRLGKQINFNIDITDEKYISKYISRTKITKTFNIYNKNTSKLEAKKVNVVYDGGYFIITDGGNPNLYHCDIYVLNPKFTNNIPTGE